MSYLMRGHWGRVSCLSALLSGLSTYKRADKDAKHQNGRGPDVGRTQRGRGRAASAGLEGNNPVFVAEQPGLRSGTTRNMLFGKDNQKTKAQTNG